MIAFVIDKILALFGIKSSTPSMDNEEEVQQQEEQNAADDIDMADIGSSDDDMPWMDDDDSLRSSGSELDDPDHIQESLLSLKFHNGIKAHYRPPYACKPLKLLKCQYRRRNANEGFPVARSGHCVIASESHLYSLGGYNPRNEHLAARRRSLFQELWSYNFATNRWKLVLNNETAANMPKELASNALEIYNNVLIAHGGTGHPFGESCSNDCHVYSTNDKPTVVKLQVTGDLPLPQYGPGIVIHDGYLYTIGGTTGFEYSCDVYRLNLATKVWENVYISRPELRDDPEGRYRHEVVCDGRHIYVLGGGTAHVVYDLQRIPAFDLQQKKWQYFETLPDKAVIEAMREDQDPGYPRPRKCLSCVHHKTSNGDIEVFISGGMQGGVEGDNIFFSDIWRLNLRTKQWSRLLSNLPNPLYFHSAAHAGNGCMYIFGGIEYAYKEVRRTNHLYKMWLTVPKLSEMCWDAVTYYNGNMEHESTQKLLKDGIPERFEKRLPTARRTVPSNKDEDLTNYIEARKRPRRTKLIFSVTV